MSYTVTFEQALKTHDMSHTTPVGQIDAYIGTDYILLRGANPSVSKVADNHYSMDDNGGIVDFPISIQGVTSIEFDLKGTYNTDGQFSKIINNALSGISGTSFNNYTVNWQHKIISLSEPTDIDYFEIYAGGARGLICEFKNMTFTCEGTKVTSNGGGATHIAKRTGQLKDLSSNLSDILMVSGGGGGGLLVNTIEYTGKEAGGISGSGDNSADQSTGNAFGQGESGTNLSGGGSGLYGGYKGTSSKGGGAGSGYIGNSLLSNKKMVGYNVPTSSAEGTKTESVNDVSASAVSGKPKSGNGFARITLKSLS